MSEQINDHGLGMKSKIKRRDFLNGVAIGIGGALVSAATPKSLFAAAAFDELPPESNPNYYPPALNGLRGNHDGSFIHPHSMRDGAQVADFGRPNDTGEVYDLVVVGGGISGLSAAYFYRKKAGKNAKILVLDNHDDFGGHAKRNEFKVGNRLLLGNGGAQSLESPGKYSKVSKALLADLGVEVKKFEKACDTRLYGRLNTAAFFAKEAFGKDCLLQAMNKTPWKEFLKNAPLDEEVKEDIARVYTENKDYLSGMSTNEKLEKLKKISYKDYLVKHCGLNEKSLPFFQAFSHDLHCVGIDATPAFDCYESGDDYVSFTYPGFSGLNLPKTEREEPYIYHFPDGNASIARMLVRKMIPSALTGSTMEDIVSARARYRELDQRKNNTRIRLNSTVVNVDPSKKEVKISYVKQNKLNTVTGKNIILACYNSMIPYICPSLPKEQKEALSYLVKRPIVYSRIALKNWTAFANLGIHQIVSPGSFHTHTALDFPVSIGSYQFPNNPKDPALLFMLRVPTKPGLPSREQSRHGRAELLQTPYEVFERNIRDQLGRMLKDGGFDPARDIAAITVNRWAHGYAYAPNSLYDPEFKKGETPWEIGRKPFGNITIANSDAEARAYMDAAIDQAFRAVSELEVG